MFLAWRLKRMSPQDAAAFWIVRAHNRPLKRREQVLFETWRADPEHARVHAEFQSLYEGIGVLGRSPAIREVCLF